MCAPDDGDQRFRRGDERLPPFTKRAIIASFLKLAAQTPLDKITIQEIVDDCDVNRNTFYYYFQDIYALAEEVLAQRAEVFFKDCLREDNDGQIFRETVDFVMRNRKAIKNIYQTVGRDEMERYIFTPLVTELERHISIVASGRNIPGEKIHFLAYCSAHAFAGMVFDWMNQNMAFDIVASAKEMRRLLDCCLDSALALLEMESN